jgi:hypothetical protein
MAMPPFIMAILDPPITMVSLGRGGSLFVHKALSYPNFYKLWKLFTIMMCVGRNLEENVHMNENPT